MYTHIGARDFDTRPRRTPVTATFHDCEILNSVSSMPYQSTRTEYTGNALDRQAVVLVPTSISPLLWTTPPPVFGSSQADSYNSLVRRPQLYGYLGG